jgi:hypothetical protein
MEGFMTDNRNIIVVKKEMKISFYKKNGMPLHKMYFHNWKPQLF